MQRGGGSFRLRLLSAADSSGHSNSTDRGRTDAYGLDDETWMCTIFQALPCFTSTSVSL